MCVQVTWKAATVHVLAVSHHRICCIIECITPQHVAHNDGDVILIQLDCYKAGILQHVQKIDSNKERHQHFGTLPSPVPPERS